MSAQKLPPKWREPLKFVLARVLSALWWGLCILIAARICFLCVFASGALSALSGAELKNFLLTSLRFDLKYDTLAFAPLLVLGLLCLPGRLSALFRRLTPYLAALGLILLTVISIINFYYYATYGRIIDVFFFAFFREDPVAVLKTLWQDYPLGTGLVLTALAITLLIWLDRRLGGFLERHLPLPSGKVALGALLLVVVGLYVVGLRGSVGKIPLRQEHAQVCADPRLNAAVPNGPTALYWAYKWHKRQSKLPEVSAEQVRADYAKLGLEAPGDDLFRPLRLKIGAHEYAAAHRPDIVFTLMESMSTHMLSLDAPGRDLLGAFRAHRDDAEDYYFTNFLSGGNGTMDSITRLLMGVPDLNLSTSEYGLKSYVTNICDMFHAEGYEVIFVTCGTGAWRGIEGFLRQQGFDAVYEESSLRAFAPEATAGAWGVDDEFLYRFVLDLLRKPSDKPRLIFAVTITNHPPYRVPGDHLPKQIPLEEAILKRFPYENTPEIFATLRYAVDELGQFITAVKSDEKLAPRTVLVATGDHNLRGIGYDAHPEEAVFGHAVPLYLHFPRELRAHDASLHFDPQRRGSHKDIFTTLASHLFSATEITSFGCDLLSDAPCRFPVMFNAEMAVPLDGDFACNLASAYTFGSVRLTKGLMADPAVTDIDGGKCQWSHDFAALERDLYHYQAHPRTAPKSAGTGK